MSQYEIKSLQEVLSGYIKEEQKISDTKIEKLTAPGENYCSVMLKLDVTLRSEKDGNETEIHAVAKKLPDHGFAKMIPNIKLTFKNEIAMYTNIIPTLQEFQRENGINEVIDFFPELYGARIILNEENGTVDDSTVLILENLVYKGYETMDRHIGFDLDTAKLVLRSLAAFHAVPLALKLKNPEEFNDKVRSHLKPLRLPSMPHEEEHKSTIIKLVQGSDKCIPWIPKLKEMFENIKTALDSPPSEPFATLTHGDMWINNTMVKHENGLPIDNKLVDFQVCGYRSPATDLFFFLFTSVQLSVLQDYFDDLMEHYHKHFISHLEKLGCDVTPFSFSKFLEEMKAAPSAEIMHTIGMLTFVVLGKKGGPSREFDPSRPPDFEKMMANVSTAAKEKVWYIVQTCGERGWLESE